MEDPCIIMVEGIIGAGKTTFCKFLGEALKAKGRDVVIIYEPVTDNDKALSLFLSDCEKYAFFFQIHMLHKRLKLYEDALKLKQDGKIVIVDRSIKGDSVFEKYFYEKGSITEKEHQYYIDTVKEKTCEIENPDMILYLDVDIPDSLDRIKREID